MSSPLPFEATKSPLVIKYKPNRRKELLDLIWGLYPDGPINIDVRAKSTSDLKRGNGQLLIAYSAPKHISDAIIAFCGMTGSPAIDSQVVRNL